ncbi:MAG: ROK family transcriptional regulator [Planctomycetaceae bacterium]|nr:ROK family transcriptional regulator [Planctomycetaceae bacterium]
MPALIQPSLLRRLNERRVLETLQKHGPASRADVSRIAGISPPTVSKAVATLLESGYLEETDAVATAFGRPAKLLRLATDQVHVIGIVLDTSKCSIVSAGLDGSIDWNTEEEIQTPDNYDDLIIAIGDRVTRLINGRAGFIGIGISVPGLVDHRQQKCLLSPNLHMIDGQSPALDLTERLEIEAILLQESQALCLEERLFGNAKGLNNFALLDVSTGLGLGVMTGGRLLEGHSGLAGELGHITVDISGRMCGCGNRGCLETVATDTAFAKAVSEKLGRQCNIEQALQIVQTGDPEVLAILDKTCEYLAIAMAAVINILNPETLLIHGKILDAQEDLFAKIIELTGKRTLKPSFKDCHIIRAKGGKKQGAIAGVIHHLTSSLAPALN